MEDNQNFMYKRTYLRQIEIFNITKRSWTSLIITELEKELVFKNAFTDEKINLRKPVDKNVIYEAKIFLSFNFYIY